LATSELIDFDNRPNRSGVKRLAATLGVGASLIFSLCWLGTLIPLASPTHAFISVFTSAQPNSGAALLEGGVWSFVFGALTGAVLAALYNLFVGLDRR